MKLKEIKDIFNKDKLLKIQEKLKICFMKIKKIFTQDKIKIRLDKIRKTFTKEKLAAALNKLRNVFTKEKIKTALNKVSNVFTKENIKTAFNKVRNVFTKEKIKTAFNKVRNVFTKEKIKTALSKVRNVFTKENIKAGLNKVRKTFTKENIIEVYKKIRSSLTKENIRRSLVNFKVKFKENKRAYISFSLVGIFLIAALVFSVNQAYNDFVPVSQRYVISENKAEEYYYNMEYDKAIEEYKNIKVKDKNQGQGLWDAKISEIYSIKGDIENSKKSMEDALKLGSKNSEVLNYIVFTEFMNKDYKTALTQGEEALKQFPKDKRLIKTMFTVYKANNEKDKAKNLLTNYPLDYKSSVDTAEYARMLMLDGQWDQGYKELRAAWIIDKDEYKIYDILAQVSVYNRDTLLENVTTLSEKNPNDLAYKMWLAKIYSLSDSTADQANKILQELKNEDVGKIEVKLIEASVLQGLKQNDKADELLKNVIDNNKGDYRVFHTAGWYYLNKKDLVNAEKYCRESIIKNKSYTDNYGFLMPEILKAEGKNADADPYFRTAIFKEPYNYNIMLTVANFNWYTTKDTAKAMEYFDYAQLINPEEPEIKYNMAQIDISNNKTDDAINLLKQCISINDSVAKYHRTLGTIYLLNGKPADGIKEIRYAYGSDQEDILTLNNAGCYYISVDQNLEKGEYNLRKAVEGINSTTDKYTSDTIKANYKKAKDFLDQYNIGKSKTLKVPDLVLFY
ncbi:tetratricopeptide repeat protein [Candidatus Clostridium stratigraminis]|uniref:Tetratricopeptide repeat protein n=1 Tax=Candidatus Clostridium stratigraminis TaxID=3381661 RepID=A0ABW8T236_9CLOT